MFFPTLSRAEVHHSAINLCAALTKTFGVTLQMLPESFPGTLAAPVSRMGPEHCQDPTAAQPCHGSRASPKSTALI